MADLDFYRHFYFTRKSKKKITEACTQFKEKIDDKIQMYQKTMSFPVNNY